MVKFSAPSSYVASNSSTAFFSRGVSSVTSSMASPSTSSASLLKKSVMPVTLCTVRVRLSISLTSYRKLMNLPSLELCSSSSKSYSSLLMVTVASSSTWMYSSAVMVMGTRSPLLYSPSGAEMVRVGLVLSFTREMLALLTYPMASTTLLFTCVSSYSVALGAS